MCVFYCNHFFSQLKWTFYSVIQFLFFACLIHTNCSVCLKCLRSSWVHLQSSHLFGDPVKYLCSAFFYCHAENLFVCQYSVCVHVQCVQCMYDASLLCISLSVENNFGSWIKYAWMCVNQYATLVCSCQSLAKCVFVCVTLYEYKSWCP